MKKGNWESLKTSVFRDFPLKKGVFCPFRGKTAGYLEKPIGFLEIPNYTYFEVKEGGYIGYFNDFPQHVTEAETLPELEDMLANMYECLNLAKCPKEALNNSIENYSVLL